MSAQTVLTSQESSKVSMVPWFEAMPVGILLIDTHGVVIYANQLAKVLFHIEIKDKWCDVLLSNVKSTCDNGHYLLTHKERYIVLKTQSLPNNDGQMILLVDESEIKENNESWMRIQNINSIGKLSATLAHQLRTPLSAAYLYTANLSAAMSQSVLLQHQEKIKQQLDNIKQQIDSVLLVHKGIDAICEKINLVMELRNIIDNFKALYPEFKFKLTTIETDMLVLGNKSALKGAISNIVENAIQASVDNKYIDIVISKQGSVIQLDVVDFGKGISSENLHKIKSGFFTTKRDGNGLGLSIARSIIDAHQGNLEISSELNQFTKITITLPSLRLNNDK